MISYWSGQIDVLTTANGDTLLARCQAVDPTLQGPVRMVNLEAPPTNTAAVLRGVSGSCVMTMNAGDSWTLTSSAVDIPIGQICVRAASGQKLNVELFR